MPDAPIGLCPVAVPLAPHAFCCCDGAAGGGAMPKLDEPELTPGGGGREKDDPRDWPIAGLWPSDMLPIDAFMLPPMPELGGGEMVLLGV